GKGGGLVVLLHGVAGVGKTLTAEAVAELLHRPLYVVGSGELGYYANQVEPALKAALERATAWNAVLLIDEADVFLEKRANADLMRNSLVATFLRLLEYHSGVLFLTTNRVKAFDEAFLSRVSVAIKYPELEINQRSRIWWQFLNHVLSTSPATAGQQQHALVPRDPETDLLGDENIKELAMKPFNGRIIKNIVRTSQALALSSDQPLSMRHLRTVISITEKFLRDTEDVRNDDGEGHDLNAADEVVSLM
ncbi:P-loop containing nucleoside triphosphate hydrolase protein, partial [Exidia glandulosa HHB12029]